MDMVVYRATAGASALEIMHLLRSHGLSPRALDLTDPLPLPLVVPIAVPEEEVVRAVRVLRAWEAQNTALVKRTTRELRRDMLLAFAFSCLAVLAWQGTRFLLHARFTAGNTYAAVAVILAGTGIGTIVIGNLRAARTRRRAIPGPRCPHCGYSLFGLTESRCPECGHSFDPALENRAARLDE